MWGPAWHSDHSQISRRGDPQVARRLTGRGKRAADGSVGTVGSGSLHLAANNQSGQSRQQLVAWMSGHPDKDGRDRGRFVSGSDPVPGSGSGSGTGTGNGEPGGTWPRTIFFPSAGRLSICHFVKPVRRFVSEQTVPGLTAWRWGGTNSGVLCAWTLQAGPEPRVSGLCS